MRSERTGLLHDAFFNGNGVAKKLIVALVLFSAAVSALITAIELYADYRRDVAQIDRSLEFIGTSYRVPLTDSVWIADNDKVQDQIDGLLRLPDIEYIGIQVDGQTRWSAGKAVSARQRARQVPLVRLHRGQPLTIGIVQIVGSVDNVFERLWSRLLVTLVGNGVKTLLVAGFMLLVFQYLVTRHLTHVAAFVRGIDPKAPQGERLRLERPAQGRWRPDILDALERSINDLSGSLREAHVELRRSEQRLRMLTQQTTAYLCELDMNGRIVFVNRTYPGLTPAQVEGSLLTDWFPASLQPTVEASTRRALTEAATQRLEYSIPDPSGIEHAYIAAITPILDAGAITGATLTAVEITEQKAAERAVRELAASLEQRVRERTSELQAAVAQAEGASRAKSEFLSRMSHELRTPMNAILGFAQILEMSDPTPKQAKWAGEIRRAGEHLVSMIEDLLDLARIEVGKMAIHIEALELQAVVHEAVALVRTIIDGRGLRLEWDLQCMPQQRVRADRLRLRQVLVNLLSNAAKYNRQGGTITVRCAPHGSAWRLAISDTGVGIDAHQLERLFQPFERLGAEGTRVEGTGIGLSLSRHLAALMGASIGVQSQVGVGSTFWIDLPGADGQGAPATTPSARSVPDAGRHLDVLYIEDDPTNTALFEAFVSIRRDVRLRTAEDGTAGLERARERRPDVIVLDIQMPGMNGYEVLRQLRGDPRLCDVPVIALSADAMPHDVQRGLAAGFDRYLSKPVVLAELLDALTALAG